MMEAFLPAVLLVIALNLIVLYLIRHYVSGGENLRAELVGDVLLSANELEKHARDIATRHRLADRPGFAGRRLPKSESAERLLRRTHRELSRALREHNVVSPAAEWFLDNFYILQTAMREIGRSLPYSYYRQLPKLVNGPLRGYPRAYAIALELVSHTDGRIDEEVVTDFVSAYQSVSPLSVGELWAIPIFLRIALMENLKNIARQIRRAHRQRVRATAWAECLLKEMDSEPDELTRILARREKHLRHLDTVFAVQVLHILRKQGSSAVPVIRWLEEKLQGHGVTADDIVHLEHQRQSSREVSIGNTITSLRTLGTSDWVDFVERLSVVEKTLRTDPEGTYALMDFPSRDRYRHAVEKIARRIGISEVQVARQAVECARKVDPDSPARKRHVGYYLIDEGKQHLLKSLGVKPKRYSHSAFRRWAAQLYIGAITAGTLFILWLLVRYANTSAGGLNPTTTVLLVLILLVPASDLVIRAINAVLTKLIKPEILPKLELRDGIPDELRTAVVVPALIPNVERGKELVNQMEVHYLANQEGNLSFVLVGDFADAPEQCTPNDEKIIRTVTAGIEELNERYPSESGPIFHFFWRRRVWNPTQNRWIGWERKRGALVELSRLLLDRGSTSFNVSELPESLQGVKYVITLDADTRLPRDAARRMIGAMAHPLHEPVIDEERFVVARGYGLLQPRIGVAITSASRSLFALTFAGQCGVDPYTSAVSDVYQDVFGEGIFTGKGIFDVEVFYRILADRFPENSILSHDLIEGCYVRAGLATDIELVDGYPARYNAYAKRLHRWVRGDWQLLPWLFRTVRTASGKRERNPISLLSKWKIIDNLRRSLVPISLMVSITGGLTYFPGQRLVWLGFALLVLAFPVVSHLATAMLSKPRGIHFAGNFWTAFGDAKSLVWHTMLSLAFLPHQAYLMIDAIVRTLVRLVTRKNLLEWMTAAEAEASLGSGLARFVRFMWPGQALALVSAAVLASDARGMLIGFPFVILWIASPVLAYRISQPQKPKRLDLTPEQKQKVRLIARRTWAYFEDFVGEGDNWLPPDNYQVDPKGEVAHRTSPTNIGLALMANLAARDFGYLTTSGVVDRVALTFGTLEKLEKWNGHFYNWYDTITLKPLEPLYVSTVDSGNLVGYLITLKQGLADLLERPLIEWAKITAGLKDTFLLAVERNATRKGEARNEVFEALAADKGYTPSLRQYELLEELKKRLKRSIPNVEGAEQNSWLRRLEQMVDSYLKEVDQFLPWVRVFREAPSIQQLGGSANDRIRAIRQRLEQDISLVGLARGSRLALEEVNELLLACGDGEQTGDDARPQKEWLLKLRDSLVLCEKNAWGVIHRTQDLIEQAEEIAFETDFRILFDPKRQLFSIGYNLEENRLTRSHYDLLASEARLASFVAIAKGDVPQKHWFHMGRMLTPVGDSRSLLSWSGTMFEYLMPLLIMKSYDHTLLDDTYAAALKAQIRYGRQRRVPWGISECAFNALDLQLNYQYQAFGVPELGLRRGLARDLIVAPYATMMAFMVDPAAAFANTKALCAAGLEGYYGFYEAIDYTRERLPRGVEGVVVKTFMVHHLGMSIMALDNYLNENIMQERFHNDPYVRATELLLQERVPKRSLLVESIEEDDDLTRKRRRVSALQTRTFSLEDVNDVHVHLNSNGEYSLMVDVAGSGYSRWKDIAVTRWREDRVQNRWGTFFYIRDLRDQSVWSATYQPTLVEPDEYEVEFAEDRAEYTRRDGNIVVKTEVSVSSEHNAEVRRLSLTNYGKDSRLLEVTSYLEVVLAHTTADLVHPAFSNLFVQTEYVASHNALLAVRRPRGEDNKPLWIMHSLAVDGEVVGDVEFETDRAKFIGRNRTPLSPAALEPQSKLSGTVGAVLDPVMSLRQRVRIAPGKTVHLVFSTAVSETREGIMTLAEVFHDPDSAERTFALAWTRSQVELRYLGLSHGDANLFQRLAAQLIYADPNLREAREKVKMANRKGQTALWAHGISGDLPIMIVKVASMEEQDIVRQALTAHEYWRMKGLQVDLVILNEQSGGYMQAVQEFYRNMVASSRARIMENRYGGVFLKQSAVLSDEDLVLLESAARVILEGSEGPSVRLAQTHRKKSQSTLLALRPTEFPQDYPSREISVGELEFANGYGGFSSDGREYVIVLEKGKHTPAPWINVVSNGFFGFQVSESGAGYAWSENSRENKLTPWSNDPIIDPPGEVIYLRDDLTGETWTPTPEPIRGEETYVIRHGHGYTRFQHHSHGIMQELLQFVPRDESVKISRLRLRNDSQKERILTVAYFVEWALGAFRQQSKDHIFTEWDPELEAVLAHNYYYEDFAGRTAFVAGSLKGPSYTGDRVEFLGTSGRYSAPDGLRLRELSGTVGGGLDPCGVLMAPVRLGPGEEREVILLLGQGKDLAQVRSIVERFRKVEEVAQAFEDAVSAWDRTLQAVQVRTPEPAFNLMANRWLLYQNLCCRVWARSAFYQSGGAYGYRDQLQDVMALLYSRPDIAREHILRAAAHQFVEGDVQHWWHPVSEKGIRTKFSDDFLWLPFATLKYIHVTGDYEILDEVIPFLKGEMLGPEELEKYGVPEPSGETASLYEHCLRAIEWGMKFGEHGLPLMGAGDWNDGMNKVGWQGSGESIWVGWFLATILDRFAEVCEKQDDADTASRFRKECARLVSAIEDAGWDGEWYRRAYYDDGTPLGSAVNDECKIDSIAQSWSVISALGDREKSLAAMRAVEDYLVREEEGLILLLAPPFDKTNKDPGYIKSYVPGVRENGGQYTHAAVWVVLATVLLGRGDRALQLMNLINPINHSRNAEEAIRYKVEPYVVAADVYAVAPNTGRGGWTWYTGAAGWMYQVMIEGILGLKVRADKLVIEPCIPSEWDGFGVVFRRGDTCYAITVRNPEGVFVGVASVEMDGTPVEGKSIPLVDDGKMHDIQVTMGKESEDH